MTQAENEAPIVVVCNGDIDFEGEAGADSFVHGIIYSESQMMEIESPKFFTSNNPLSFDVNLETKSLAKDNGVVMEKVVSPKIFKQWDKDKGLIETKAPIASVKSAISKFGGIVDWKSHRVHNVERSKSVEQEFEEAQEEIIQNRKRSEAAVEAEFRMLKELEDTKQQIEELELALESAEMEEQQSKQDVEMVRLRLREVEEEIAEENSVKAELEVAMAEHDAAVSELKSIKEELETVRKDFSLLVNERDLAVKNADDAVAASGEAEKAIEELTNELMAIKQSFEAAQVAHIEAEEQRLGVAMTKEQDCFNWKKELDEAEEEFCRLNLKVQSIEVLKLKVDTASSLLLDLKAEMTVYMESVFENEISDEQNMKGAEDVTIPLVAAKAAVNSTKRELKEVNLNIEKAIAEVECLKMASSSLQSELEEEKSAIASTKQREAMSSIEAASLEAELEKKELEINVVNVNMKEAEENRRQLTIQLEQAAQEADEAKSLARIACDELHQAKIEAEQAKAERTAMESRLFATQKEIEAAAASKLFALEAIEALQESNSPTGISISLDEYNELSNSACEAEEQANTRVTKAFSEVEAKKEYEAKSLKILEEASQELASKQEELEAAKRKAEEAEEQKLAAEQELRILSLEREKQQKDSESDQEVSAPTTSSSTSLEVKESTNNNDEVVLVPVPVTAPAAAPKEPSSNEQTEKNNDRDDSLSDSKNVKKKKKSFFPKMLTLLGKSKSNRSKTT